MAHHFAAPCASSNQLQHQLLELLKRTQGFQGLLQEAWDDFQRLRSALDLVQVPDMCLTPELRLESDRWVPGTAWTRPNQKGWAWRKPSAAGAAASAESGEVPPGLEPSPVLNRPVAPPRSVSLPELQ